MATHSSTLAWTIPQMAETGRLQWWGREESDSTEWLHFHSSLSCTGEENGNLLQYSCLENPRDRRAWWAAVYGVTESDTTDTTSQQQQHYVTKDIGCNSRGGDFCQVELWNFLLYFFIFHWGIIASQCCIGFCHTIRQISHKNTCVPSLLNSFYFFVDTFILSFVSSVLTVADWGIFMMGCFKTLVR